MYSTLRTHHLWKCLLDYLSAYTVVTSCPSEMLSPPNRRARFFSTRRVSDCSNVRTSPLQFYLASMPFFTSWKVPFWKRYAFTAFPNFIYIVCVLTQIWILNRFRVYRVFFICRKWILQINIPNVELNDKLCVFISTYNCVFRYL